MDLNGRKIINVLRKEVVIQLLADYKVSQSEEIGKSPERFNHRSKQTRSQIPLELSTILYGPTTLFEKIGIFAAKCHLYLQHPRHCDRDVPYRNPHCLSPEDGRVISTFDLLATLGSFNCSGPEFYANPNDLFADATEQDVLNETHAPQNLSTELYKHQKQALTFMMQRERGWAMDGHHKDIWREEHDCFGRSMYQNLISGMKQRTKPDQFQGGLLIDAPGLGKSLSIIALILSDAETEGQRGQMDAPSSATLLVVPTTCEPRYLPMQVGTSLFQ